MEEKKKKPTGRPRLQGASPKGGRKPQGEKGAEKKAASPERKPQGGRRGGKKTGEMRSSFPEVKPEKKIGRAHV